MVDSDSDDDLHPPDSRGSDFGRSFFSNSDDEPDVRSFDSDDASFASSLRSSPLSMILTTIPTIQQLAPMMFLATICSQFQGVKGGKLREKYLPLYLLRN
jgi:hypothetical protein